MLNPGPGFTCIRCPACPRGEIRLASDTREFRCWCGFASRNESDLRLPSGERLVIVDFTPFAHTEKEA